MKINVNMFGFVGRFDTFREFWEACKFRMAIYLAGDKTILNNVDINKDGCVLTSKSTIYLGRNVSINGHGGRVGMKIEEPFQATKEEEHDG